MKLKNYFDNLEHINEDNINTVCEDFDKIDKFAPMTSLPLKQKS